MGAYLRIDINLFATLYLGIVFSLAYRRLDHQDAFNRLFFISSGIMMSMTLFEAFTCLLNHNPAPWARGLSMVMHLFLFATPPLISYYWLLLADTLTLHGNVAHMKPNVLMMMPVWIGLVVVLLTPFFNWVFYIDQNGVYHRGPLYFLIVFIAYGYLLTGFLLLLKRRKNLIGMDFQFLSLFCLLPMIGGLVQGLVYGVLLMWASQSCSLTIVYLYLQERMIQTDYLTGAWTRHSFEYTIAQKLRSNRHTPFGVVYADIDNLKHINDAFGHMEGDSAIRATVVTIREVLRKGDAVARLGGDEFAILLNVPDYDTLQGVIQRIGKALDVYNDNSGKPYRLSLSLGGDVFEEAAEGNVDTIVDRVDCLMYAQKNRKNGCASNLKRRSDQQSFEPQEQTAPSETSPPTSDNP